MLTNGPSIGSWLTHAMGSIGEGIGSMSLGMPIAMDTANRTPNARGLGNIETMSSRASMPTFPTINSSSNS